MNKIWSMHASAIWITAVLVVLSRVAWASGLANTDDIDGNEEEQRYSRDNFAANPFEYNAVDMFGVSTFIHPPAPTLDRREAYGGRMGHRGDARRLGGGFNEHARQPSHRQQSFGGQHNQGAHANSLPFVQKPKAPTGHASGRIQPSAHRSSYSRYRTSLLQHTSHGLRKSAGAGSIHAQHDVGAKFHALERGPTATNSSSTKASTVKKSSSSKSSSSSSKANSTSSKTSASKTGEPDPEPSDICGDWYKFVTDRVEIYGKHFDASLIGEDGSKLRWALDGKCGVTTYYKFTRLENDPNGMQWHATINMAIGTKDCVGNYLKEIGGQKDGCSGVG